MSEILFFFVAVTSSLYSMSERGGSDLQRLWIWIFHRFRNSPLNLRVFACRILGSELARVWTTLNAGWTFDYNDIIYFFKLKKSLPIHRFDGRRNNTWKLIRWKLWNKSQFSIQSLKPNAIIERFSKIETTFVIWTRSQRYNIIHSFCHTGLFVNNDSI